MRDDRLATRILYILLPNIYYTGCPDRYSVKEKRLASDNGS